MDSTEIFLKEKCRPGSSPLPTYSQNAVHASLKKQTFTGTNRNLEQIEKRPPRETKVTPTKTLADLTSKCVCCFCFLLCWLLASLGRTDWKSELSLHPESSPASRRTKALQCFTGWNDMQQPLRSTVFQLESITLFMTSTSVSQWYCWLSAALPPPCRLIVCCCCCCCCCCTQGFFLLFFCQLLSARWLCLGG